MLIGEAFWCHESKRLSMQDSRSRWPMLSALGTHSLHVLHITMFAEIHCSKSVKQLIGLHHGLQLSGAPLRRSLQISCRRFLPRFLFIEVPGQGAFHPPTT